MARTNNESEFTQQVIETLEQNEPVLRAVVSIPSSIIVAAAASVSVGAICAAPTSWVDSIWTVRFADYFRRVRQHLRKN